jgi:hypothetical protein
MVAIGFAILALHIDIGAGFGVWLGLCGTRSHGLNRGLVWSSQCSYYGVIGIVLHDLFNRSGDICDR